MAAALRCFNPHQLFADAAAACCGGGGWSGRNLPRVARVRCKRNKSSSEEVGSVVEDGSSKKGKKRLSEQSSWEAKDSEGKDYLYRLGKEADNMNIAVGARASVMAKKEACRWMEPSSCPRLELPNLIPFSTNKNDVVLGTGLKL